MGSFIYITGENEINKTTNIFNIFFTFNCNNISQCLFCTDINDKELLLFNTPISKKEFEKYKQELQQILKDITFEFVENWGTEQLPLQCPTLKNQKLLYQNIPNSLLEWIQTLPNYNKIILDKIILH